MARNNLSIRSSSNSSVPSSSKRRRNPISRDNNFTSNKARQQTLTQIHFIPRTTSPPSEIDLEEQTTRTPNISMAPPSNRRTYSRKQARVSTAPQQKSTITQMDFLSRAFPPDSDEDEMMPEPSTTRPQKRRRISEQCGLDGANAEPERTPTKRTTKTGSKKKKLRSDAQEEHDPMRRGVPNKEIAREVLQRQLRPSVRNAEAGYHLTKVAAADTTIQDSGPGRAITTDNQDGLDPDIPRPGFFIHEDSPSQSISLPQTPVTRRKKVIQSSQSPESIVLSTQKRDVGLTWTRQSPKSPLKERSANVESPTRSAGKQYGFMSCKKRVCERQKSKIVVLPVALTSQGGVGRGAYLPRSPQQLQADFSLHIPFQSITNVPADFPPSPEDESKEDWAQDSLPSLSALLEKPRNSHGEVAADSAAVDHERSELTKSQITAAIRDPSPTSAKTGFPVLEEDEDEEPPFSPGTPIRSSISAAMIQEWRRDHYRTKSSPAVPQLGSSFAPRNVTVQVLSPRSDSAAVSSQLHSDILSHGIQTEAPIDQAGFSVAELTTQARPSQVSTQEPTQTQRQVPTSQTEMMQSSPKENVIKIKSSSSMHRPMHEIASHPRSEDALQLEPENEFWDDTDASLDETDDLNPQTLPRTGIQPEELMEETRRNLHIAQSQSGDEDSLDLASQSTSPDSELPLQPHHATQCALNAKFNGPTPPQVSTGQAHADILRSSQGQLHAPFSSSPIIKGAIWQLPDSMLESLPGPPPGWEVRWDEMKKI